MIAAIGLAVAFTGCKKYDEGPTLSLASKKGRVANIWKIEKFMENGVDLTAAALLFFNNVSWEFKKDKTYIISSSSSTNAETGTWDFDSKKENLILTPNGGSNAYKEEIIRLTSNEMWWKEVDGSDTYEYHFSSK